MMKTPRLVTVFTFSLILVSASFAQIPGDGIPDVHLVGRFGTFLTSAGEITRPEGTVLVDTDGNDMVALLIQGPDIITNAPNDGNYLAGNTTFLPDPNAGPPLFASSWGAIEYFNGVNQYIRTDPLDTDGFVGVIGEYPGGDPFEIFPDLGLGVYEGNPFDLCGQPVIFATSTMGEFETEVYGTACVPEPTSASLLILMLFGLLGLRRV